MLDAGTDDVLKAMAIAHQEGSFALEADVTWRVGDGRPNVKSASLTLTAAAEVQREAGVTIHASRAETEVGQPVKLILSAANPALSPSMTVKFTLGTAPGWSLMGPGFTAPCAGQCIATYMVGSGEEKRIDLELVPDRAGPATVEARLEWHFGDDVSTLRESRSS